MVNEIFLQNQSHVMEVHLSVDDDSTPPIRNTLFVLISLGEIISPSFYKCSSYTFKQAHAIEIVQGNQADHRKNRSKEEVLVGRYFMKLPQESQVYRVYH